MHCAHTSAQAHRGRTRGRVKLILQPVGLEPARSYHLMLRQKDHSANAEHCDTGTPEIRIHIPAGTGRSTVTVEIYHPQSPNPRQICTCIHVCMHRDPAVMRADAWNHISHRTSANAVQISYLSVYAIHPALAHNITVILQLRGTFFERKEVYYYHDLPTITAHDCSRKDKSERAP